MQKSFYLSKNGQHVGPFTFDEVLQKIAKQEHQWMDYVYDEVKKDWVLLIEHPLFSEKYNSTHLKEVSEKENKKTKELDHLKERAWYTLKNGSNYGPFSQIELIQMLQERSLFEYDYIWHQSLPTWKRISEVNEFSPEKIRAIKETKHSEISEIFFRRRHLRAEYDCPLIVHDNKTVFRGKSLQISAGGAALLIDTSSLQAGQTLFLHFQPGSGVPPFNAVCSVVSKQYPGENEDQSFIKYGVRFTSVSQSVREKIKSFTETTKKAG